MLFNSFVFILVFLPIVLSVYYSLGHYKKTEYALAWLVTTSLFFYGWWNPKYLILIVISILVNYFTGQLLQKNTSYKKALLTIGVFFNLGALGYYKYANFFIDSLNSVSGSTYHLDTIILPLAISFFTFQQITYIIDAYQSKTKEYNFLHYCLFVTFFPQLIAGPIVHHSEMMPQFKQSWVYQFRKNHFAIGLTLFFLGLFKKVVFADGVAVYATPVFTAADSGMTLSFFEAWGGALAYTFQLYFDFSGYSDMAIGIARMFGIKLPLNFYSPYKAKNIIEFWRNWHMTLSRFLRDYIYITLGGNRKGTARRYTNLMITMLVGGMWHGAGWTFFIWGALHGIYLIINQLWIAFTPGLETLRRKNNILYSLFSWSLTFIAVVFAWVLFRAENFNVAMSMIKAMTGANGISLPTSFKRFNLPDYFDYIGLFPNQIINTGWTYGIALIGILALIAFFAPNTNQVLHKYFNSKQLYQGKVKPPKLQWLAWRPTMTWAVVLLLISFYALHSMLSTASEFLYFQF